jgi:hypothetical protein
VFFITDKTIARRGGGRRLEGIGVVTGVMKDEEVKFQEIEAVHTLGGVGRY